jgi:hypothetical protein
MGEFGLLEPIGDYAVLMFWWLANISAKVCNILEMIRMVYSLSWLNFKG